MENLTTADADPSTAAFGRFLVKPRNPGWLERGGASLSQCFFGNVALFLKFLPIYKHLSKKAHLGQWDYYHSLQ